MDEITERAIRFGPSRNLVGIISEITDHDAIIHLPGIILLNAGLVHRVGPSRIYVKMARKLAELVHSFLRFDFSGIGDSNRRTDTLSFEKSAIQETGHAMDFLSNSRGINQFVLIGLCSGASISFQVAKSEKRVVGTILINTPLPESNLSEAIQSNRYYSSKALFRPQSWMKLILGKSSYRGIIQTFGYILKNKLSFGDNRPPEPNQLVQSIDESMRSFKKRGVFLFMISSQIELGLNYLNKVVGSLIQDMKTSGILQTAKIPGADHTFTPLSTHSELIDMTIDWMTDIDLQLLSRTDASN